MKPEMRVNDQITARQVRLIIAEDNFNEVVSLDAAVRAADKHGLDLVQINEADVPVCKIMDFSRHIFEQKMIEKKRAKQQRATTIKTKEVQISADIGENDCKVKQTQIRKFLDQGMQVRIMLRLTGRAKGNQDMIQRARDKVELFIQNISGKFAFVQSVQLNSDTFSVIIVSRGDKEA